MSQLYCVAGYPFVVAGAPFAPANLRPFEVQEGEPVFRVQCVHALPLVPRELLFQTEDGPGFPEIILYKAASLYRIQMRPLPGAPLACEMEVDPYFREARLLLLGTDNSFGLNNALMLLFAFATARLGALEMHASVVMQDGKGYLFLGRSGTGKSTHSRLWMQYIPGTELLNDDNPILRLMPDGTARVYGSPWSGKTPCYKSQDVPVGAVVRLSQAPENRIRRLPLVQAYASLMSSASSFRPFRELADGWHRTLEGLVSVVPCYHLDCLPDQAAAELCYKTVHG